MRRGVALLLSVTLGFSGSVAGQGIQGASTGLVSPTTTITFSEFGLPANTALTDQYSAYGVTFTNLWQDPQPVVLSAPTAGNFILNSSASNPVTIQFSGTVTEAAFNIFTNPGTSFFEAFLGATSQHSFSASTTTQAGFWYGFEGIAFDRIVFSGGGSGGALLIDNLQFGDIAPVADVVPEPATMTLLATGLAGLVAARRRKMSR